LQREVTARSPVARRRRPVANVPNPLHSEGQQRTVLSSKL
jgi:hypothetical protein